MNFALKNQLLSLLQLLKSVFYHLKVHLVQQLLQFLAIHSLFLKFLQLFVLFLDNLNLYFLQTNLIIHLHIHYSLCSSLLQDNVLNMLSLFLTPKKHEQIFLYFVLLVLKNQSLEVIQLQLLLQTLLFHLDFELLLLFHRILKVLMANMKEILLLQAFLLTYQIFLLMPPPILTLNLPL